MTRCYFDRLNPAKPRYDLAKIMRRKECPIRSVRAKRPIIVGFETPKLAKAEDAKRRELAIATLASFPELVDEKLVRRLIDDLDYGDCEPPHSRASSLRMRDYRRRLPEPYSTIYLAALNELSFSDTIIMYGVGIYEGKLALHLSLNEEA